MFLFYTIGGPNSQEETERSNERQLTHFLLFGDECTMSVAVTRGGFGSRLAVVFDTSTLLNLKLSDEYSGNSSSVCVCVCV